MTEMQGDHLLYLMGGLTTTLIAWFMVSHMNTPVWLGLAIGAAFVVSGAFFA